MLHGTPAYKNTVAWLFWYAVDTNLFILEQEHQNLFFFKSVKFTCKIRNRLNRKKNQISDFYFMSYGHFGTKLSGTKLSQYRIVLVPNCPGTYSSVHIVRSSTHKFYFILFFHFTKFVFPNRIFIFLLNFFVSY